MKTHIFYTVRNFRMALLFFGLFMISTPFFAYFSDEPIALIFIILLPIIAITGVFLIYRLTARIILTRTKITSETLFSKKHLNWKDIRHFGAYEAYEDEPGIKVSFPDIDTPKRELVFTWMYLSSQETVNVRNFHATDITAQYSKEAYQLIVKALKNGKLLFILIFF